MKIKTSNKSKKTLIFSLVAILMTIVLLIPLFTTKPKSKDTTAEIQEQTITFSIDNEEFSANREMTWEQWVDSEYNTEEYFIDENNFIRNENEKLTRNEKYILKYYFVIENGEYEFIIPPIPTFSFSLEYVSFIAEEDMTWEDWVVSDFNLTHLVVDENNNISYHGEIVKLNNVNVLKTDLIIANTNYDIETIIYSCLIDDIPCFFTYGMTWGEWLNAYNFQNVYYADNNNNITDGNGFITYNGTYVLKTDYIVANRIYEIVTPTLSPRIISFTIDSNSIITTYHAEDGMTWAEWIASEYGYGYYDDDEFGVVYSGAGRLGYSDNGLFQDYVFLSETIIENYCYEIFSGGSND